MLTITTETRRFVLKENAEQSEKKFNEIIMGLLGLQKGKEETKIEHAKIELQHFRNQRMDMSTKVFYISAVQNVAQREGYAPKQDNIVSIVMNAAVMMSLKRL